MKVLSRIMIVLLAITVASTALLYGLQQFNARQRWRTLAIGVNAMVCNAAVVLLGWLAVLRIRPGHPIL